MLLCRRVNAVTAPLGCFSLIPFPLRCSLPPGASCVLGLSAIAASNRALAAQFRCKWIRATLRDSRCEKHQLIAVAAFVSSRLPPAVIRVKTNGLVKIVVNVATRNMEEWGYDVGGEEVSQNAL
jgi:hypothetical protein